MSFDHVKQIHDLEQRFGDEFRDYRSSTPTLFPKIT